MASRGVLVTVRAAPLFLWYNFDTDTRLMKKDPRPKKKKTDYAVCKKCGKWYASHIAAMGHGAGACDKITDARELYDFTD